MNDSLNLHDVVQIDPTSDPVFGGCFLIVTDVKPRSVVGYMFIPRAQSAGIAYYRAPLTSIRRIGTAQWTCETMPVWPKE